MNASFLNRIVEKALGVASSIEPRLPSLYESLAGADVMSGLDMERSAPTIVESRVETPESMATPVLKSTAYEPEQRSPDGVEISVEQHSQTQTQSVEEPPQVGVLVAPESRVAMAVRTTSDTSVPHMAHAVPDTPRRARASKASRQGDPVARQINTASPLQAVLMPGKTPTILHSEDDARPARDTAPTEPAQVEHRTQNEISKGALMPSQIPALLQSRISRIAPNIPERKPQDIGHGESIQAQQAPVINVTIGRVEVRAVQGPAGKARVEPAKQKPMNLDEYLKQQRGRR